MADPGAQDRSGSPAPIGGDAFVPLLAVGLTLYYLVDTAPMLWEARSTGTLVGGALLALCGLQFGLMGLRVWGGRASLRVQSLFGTGIILRQRLLLLAAQAVFIVTLPWTGITLGLFAVMAVCLAVTGARPVATLVISGVTATCVFLGFVLLLQSRLPRGPLDHALLGLFGIESR